MYNKGDKIYHFPSNFWENGIELLKVETEHNGITYCDDYTKNFPSSDYTFCRLENAERAMKLLAELHALRGIDNARHILDIKESVEYKRQTEGRLQGVIDVISESLGKGVVRFNKDSMRDFAANSGKQIHWGVLDLGNLKVVPSDSEDGIYYPVTRSECGCPSWYYGMRKMRNGRCKHQKEHFPE